MFLVVGLLYVASQWYRDGQIRFGDFVVWPRQAAAGGSPATEPAARAGVVERLFADQRSDVVVRIDGEVDRLLLDDLEGSRHQRFILRLASGHTVLVAHNIDLARRAPLRRGDRVEVKGEYEWNERGGVIHWTHRDPRGRHEGGWIKHEGDVYQ